MRLRIFALLLVVLIALPAFSTLRLDYLEIYFTGVRLLNGRQQLGTRVGATYLGFFGNPSATEWKTVHGFEDAFTQAAAATTGVLFHYDSVWRSSFSMYGAYSTCYRARAVAEVVNGEMNSWGSSMLCTESRPIEDPPCEYTPEGCWERVGCGSQEGCWEKENCPLIVNVGQGPWRLSGLDDAVLFDIDGDGTQERVTWTARGSTLAFVAFDRNGNGTIDGVGELFGDYTPLASGEPARNGFRALREFDTNGDGIVNVSDPAWQTLSLWMDTNHDGVAQPGELRPIAGSAVDGLGTQYHWSGRVDPHGNTFRLQSEVFMKKSREPYYDIYFRIDR